MSQSSLNEFNAGYNIHTVQYALFRIIKTEKNYRLIKGENANEYISKAMKSHKSA